jgi:intraflagellar transport protein 52
MFKPEKLDHAEDLCPEVLLGNGASAISSSLQGGLPLGGTAGPAVLVLGCPTQPFTAAEFNTLRLFLGGGGSLLVCLSEGGEAKAGTNINYLLEELGIAVNADAVVRTAQYKYLHPKEALISDGVVNRTILMTAGGGIAGNSNTVQQRRGISKSHARHVDSFHTDNADILYSSQGDGGAAAGGKGLDFVYPYGCTLSVQPPAVPLLSTGRISYPMQRPVGELQLGRQDQL